MSKEFSLTKQNEHFSESTPQGDMLRCIFNLTGRIKDLWYADTFSLPTFGHLKKYYSGTVILYCWWDPADDRILIHLDDMDLEFIIITSDPQLVPKHPKIKTIKWTYQYGYFFELIKPFNSRKQEKDYTFLCMMRNHKSERLAFLEELWRNGLLKNNLVSYLGQVNTGQIHGRTNRTYEDLTSKIYIEDSDFEYTPPKDFANFLKNLPLELSEDTTQTLGNNTDFFTCGNPEWYARTQYSVILETYWARTQFLTEKSFKPIVAGHPFINLGNMSNSILNSLGFDVFDDVFDCGFVDALPARNKISATIPLLTSIDIDTKRCTDNQHNGQELLLKAKQEQKELAQQVINLL